MTDDIAKGGEKPRFLVTLIALILPTLVTWVYFSLLSQHPAWIQKLAYGVGKSVQFALPIVALAYFGQWITHDKARYRLSLIYGIITGVAIGASMYALYRFALVPTGVMDGPKLEVLGKLQEMQLNSLATFAAVGLGYAIVHSLLEEYYWRWFVFGQLKSLVSTRTALVVSSLGFSAHHVLVLARYFGWNSPWTYLCTAGVAVGGVIWSAVYHRTSTLAGPWISHGIVDAVIFYIGYELAFAGA